MDLVPQSWHLHIELPEEHPAPRHRYSWFAPDTSGGIFSWIGPTASLLSNGATTSVGAIYAGQANAAINAINAHAQGRPLDTTGMSKAEARS